MISLARQPAREKAGAKRRHEQKTMDAFSKDCLSGKRVLITGGLGAIGHAVVKRLLEVSATVAVNDILEEGKATEVIRSGGWPGDRCLYFRADVTKPNEARSLDEKATAAMGRLDVAICH